MNIPNVKNTHIVDHKKEKKHVQKVSKAQYEKGDPEFVDERKKEKPQEEESFLASLFNFDN